MNKMIRAVFVVNMALVDVEVFEGQSDRTQETNWVSYTGWYIMDDYGNAVKLGMWATLLGEW